MRSSEGLGTCSTRRACSHGLISSSHACTSDCRADDIDCMIPSIIAFNYARVKRDKKMQVVIPVDSTGQQEANFHLENTANI